MKYFFLLKNLWHFFKTKKNSIFVILLLMLLSGFAEMISFTTIIPFLTVLTDPDRLFEIEKIRIFLDLIKVDSATHLFFYISFFFIIVSLIAASIKLSTIWIKRTFCSFNW